MSVVCSVVVWALLPVLRVLGSNLVLELPCLLHTVSCVILHHTRSSVIAYIFSLIPLVIAKIISWKSFFSEKKINKKILTKKKVFCTSRRLLLISHRGSHRISHRWSELYYYCDDCKISHPDSNAAMTPRWLKGYVGLLFSVYRNRIFCKTRERGKLVPLKQEFNSLDMIHFSC